MRQEYDLEKLEIVGRGPGFNKMSDEALKDFLITVRSALLMVCKWIERHYGLKEAK